ncbi:MAG: beta-lactamase domain protein [Gammaproteobacteria bacterium]|nr:beta-lactamase domain protein [Gammaproteobacteria bacterium]MBM2830681.1 beta-lactamase domain protein [Gammaproteobacteria bacterium]
MLIFRQLFDQQSSTYTYLLADDKSREAVLIDPVFEQMNRDAALLAELKLALVCVLDTHCHADHVTSAWLLKQKTGAKIAISTHAGVDNADRYLSHGDQIKFGRRYLTVRETPGHTNGCLTCVLDDESKAFTGDCLLIRGCGRTDFQHGDSRKMYQSIHNEIFTLPDETLLYPAHDYRGLTVTSVVEEKNYNPRLGGKLSASDFDGYMRNLNLPHPRQIDIAVPANLKSGKPEQELLPQQRQQWAPLNYTFAGFLEIEPQAMEERLQHLQVIDVRTPEEYNGPLGHIPNARLLPLDKLNERVDEIGHDKPVVTVCRAGGRSAQATVILQKAGFNEVANLAGGMLRWRAEGHPVIGNVD